MNALAANDIEAADLLARLDGDGSPGRCGPAMVMPRPPRTDMIATAQEPKDQRPPARDHRRAQRGGPLAWAPAGDRQRR